MYDHGRNPVEGEVDIGHVCAGAVQISCLHYQMLTRVITGISKLFRSGQQRDAAAAGGVSHSKVALWGKGGRSTHGYTCHQAGQIRWGEINAVLSAHAKLLEGIA